MITVLVKLQAYPLQTYCICPKSRKHCIFHRVKLENVGLYYSLPVKETTIEVKPGLAPTN